MSGGFSYEAAGVSIERGEEAAKMMRASVEGTHSSQVLSPLGGFAGLYALSGYAEPVLASTIDGVGSSSRKLSGVTTSSGATSSTIAPTMSSPPAPVRFSFSTTWPVAGSIPRMSPRSCGGRLRPAAF
jgi:hypothetical protein